MIGVAGLAAILAVVAAAIAAVFTALGLPWIERLLRRRTLARRSSILECILAAPLIAMFLFPVLCLLPSFAAVVVPSMDHCLHHDDHPVHLCFVHLPTVPTLFTVVGVGLLSTLALLVIGNASRHAWRVQTSARM